jgi:hypothetical protein
MPAKDIMTSPLGETHEGAWPYLQGLEISFSPTVPTRHTLPQPRIEWCGALSLGGTYRYIYRIFI